MKNNEKESELKSYHALPRSCFLPSERGIISLVGSIILPELKKIMTDKDIIAAHNEKQPYLDRMKKITCKGCPQKKCPHNPRFHPLHGSVLQTLMNGNYSDRIDKGEELLKQLFPQEKRKELEKINVKCLIFQTPSRKNPTLSFILTPLPPKNKQFIMCNIGRAELSINAKNQTLNSIFSLEEAIEAAISAVS